MARPTRIVPGIMQSQMMLQKRFRAELLFGTESPWSLKNYIGLKVTLHMADKINASDLKSQKDNFIIIDVREADELAGGKIDGSIHMPLGLAIRNAKKKQIEEMREKKICTYCGTGYRGNIAADELNKEGFNAVTLEGGYPSWNQ